MARQTHFDERHVQDASLKRHRHQALKAAGLCVICGNVPPALGRTRCEPCAQLCNKRMADCVATAKARGLCRKCLIRPIAEGFKQCPSGYQVLCMNCQFLKEAQRREDLHQAGTPILRGIRGVNGPPQRPWKRAAA